MTKKHLTIPNSCLIVREKSSKYRNNCSNPFRFVDGDTPWKNQVHHILCEHAIQDIKPSGDSSGTKRQYIEDCLCGINWDINNATNLIGLPVRSAYIKSKGLDPINLCCHTVDHNTTGGYTYECKAWLHKNVWNKLIAKQKVHQVDVDNIKKQLEKCISTFKGILTKRAQRNQGTKHSWNNRFKEPSTWYYPFSMAQKATPRSPGVSINSLKVIFIRIK